MNAIDISVNDMISKSAIMQIAAAVIADMRESQEVSEDKNFRKDQNYEYQRV